MKTTPRTDFEKPVVVTIEERCPRCNSTRVHQDTHPPAGATWNPPSALALATPRPRWFWCKECSWSWFPDHSEQRGSYMDPRAKRANHDPGDEDRSIK